MFAEQGAYTGDWCTYYYTTKLTMKEVSERFDRDTEKGGFHGGFMSLDDTVLKPMRHSDLPPYVPVDPGARTVIHVQWKAGPADKVRTWFYRLRYPEPVGYVSGVP